MDDSVSSQHHGGRVWNRPFLPQSLGFGMWEDSHLRRVGGVVYS